MNIFEEYGLSKWTIQILEQKWFSKPSPIQEETWPILIKNEKDLIGQSQTWSGKTAAFGIPIVENLLKNKKWKHIKAVVLCPSRELAIQVWNEINSFVWKRDISVFTIYWWQSYIKEKRKIKSWIDILVGTPWRIIDHLKNKAIDFSKIEYFVLDEADEMLNMWFIDDIEEILKNTPTEKRTILFSATMPKAIMKIATNYMQEFETIKVKSKTLTSDTVEQKYYLVKPRDKSELLYRILDIEVDFYGIVFCRTKIDVDELNRSLKQKWYNADSIHWDISQNQREKVILNFKKWYTKILIATDVAARGLDVNNLSHVINYSIPENTEDYTHRIWRTWRAWKDWIAITFVTPQDRYKINNIMRKTNSKIIKEDIPDISYIMDRQREKLIEWIWNIIDKNKFEENIDLAKELLKLDKSEIIVSSLIRLLMKDKFAERKYQDISEPKVINSKSFDDDWQARLFVAMWKSTGKSPKEIIDYICEWSWVDSKNIDDLKVLNDFSFITVNSEDSKKIIRSFYTKWDGGRPLVSKAKKKK